MVDLDESTHPSSGLRGGSLPLTRFPDDPADAIGTVLDGRYHVRGILGEGAMAIVYSARHVFLETDHAVKVLHPSLAALDEMKARFLREAQVTRAVAHEGLVSVSDFGVSPEGLHYLVMEKLDGEELLTWSERRGAATAEEVTAIGLAILEPLIALHDAGFVHRDLKPENLWLVPAGEGRPPRVKVLDLGIAAANATPPDGQARVGRKDLRRLTRAGHTLGTALYMSPEQALGLPVDGRSDLFSLGCVLWELATDRLAFQGETATELMAGRLVARVEPPSRWNATLPAWFDGLVLRLMEPERDQRFPSARSAYEAFGAALAAHREARPMLATTRASPQDPFGPALETSPVSARAPTVDAPSIELGPAPAPSRATRSSLARLGVLAAVFAALALFIAWRLVASDSPSTSPTAAETASPAPTPPVEVARQPAASGATPPPSPGPVTPASSSTSNPGPDKALAAPPSSLTPAPSPTQPLTAPPSITPTSATPSAVPSLLAQPSTAPARDPTDDPSASPTPSGTNTAPAKTSPRPRPRPARPETELWQPARPTGAP